MKPISRRPIFTLSFFATASHRTIKNSHFVAFSTQTHQGSGFHPRRQEEESRSVRVSVWWDFENCNLPLNTNVFRVAQCITNAVRANGIKGPIQITAFGDVMQISRTNQEALSSTGISLTHVPSGGKNSADRSLLVDLMYWVSQNPPPAHLFLISGDRDFAGILHRLRMNNYNILLASPDSAPSVLCSAATIMWQWSSLLKGENLTGKLFNQPPDGPYNSWYGYYKAPLEDPFPVTDQSSCLHTDESCGLAPDSKPRPIPKAVMKHIRQILNSYPEGISITNLRAELAKSNLTIDKDFYGCKKFSRFLLAMPHILRLYNGTDGQLFARGANTKFLDESVVATYVEPTANDGEPEVGSVAKPNGEVSASEDMSEKSRLFPVPEPKSKAQSANSHEYQKEEKQNESSSSLSLQGTKVKAQATQDQKNEEKRKETPSKRNIIQEIRQQERKGKVQEKPKQVDVASPGVEIKESSEKRKNQVVVPNELSSAPEIGIFRRIWMWWFGSGDTNSSKRNCRKGDEKSAGKDNIEEKTLITCQSAKSVHPAIFSPSSHEALVDGKIARSSDAVTDVSSQGSSFFNRSTSWFKLWSSWESDDKVEKNGETVDQMEVTLEQSEIFLKESFWKELESFIDTSEGVAAVLESRTREHLVQNLRKQGPPVLSSLPEGDLLHLVDLLVSDKKWVEVDDSRTFPFRLTMLAGKHPHHKPPLSSNGLSHIFSGRQPNLQESGERKHQNPPHAGVQQPVVHRVSSGKPRSEILADCQKLVDHIVKEYPEGFNMGSFRKLFLEKHGYALDLQKLGYEKLVNLLQIMPGVRIESNLIVPASAFKNLDPQNIGIPMEESKVSPVIDSHGESSVSSTKDDDGDSSWDELGPLDSSGPGKRAAEARLNRKGQNGRTESRLPDYEPLEEDDISDSEEETSSKSENEIKSRLEEESSLLQILDSWYSNKGADGRKDESTSTANATDSTEIGLGTKNESPVVNPTRKQKSVRTYSFVMEQPVDDKDKLVDGILGSLKKSSEKSTESRVLG
ncbi:uncharacterized protein LOC105171114 [Sesamum indicum]|uniref:Uncharacterized protein LOC105171114 n=1 Tax=Sesamum indicum TaxID=4182 RepID=A0A6I9TU90_SESIN|nr:uncharacterized protein LOC105171114 [Sesamum indicum]